MIRLILYILWFYIIYRLIKAVVGFVLKPGPKRKETPPTREPRINPGDIEDIDYEEVNRDDPS
ncbi:MAG: hypothetical protein Kow0037_24330 [Calditrichia bacterium]